MLVGAGGLLSAELGDLSSVEPMPSVGSLPHGYEAQAALYSALTAAAVATQV